MLRRSWHFVTLHGWKFTVLVAALALVFLWLIKAPIMGVFISEKTGVPVTMRAVSLWPTETTIHHFAIANPRAFGRKPAFRAAKIQLRYTYDEIASVPSVINQLVFSNAYLYIQLPDGTGKGSNWARIAARMPKRKHPREVIIHKILVQNLTVEIEGKGAIELGVAGTNHFDEIELDEIDSNQGFPTKEIAQEIFVKAGLGKYVEGLLNPAERVEETINIFNFFGKAPK